MYFFKKRSFKKPALFSTLILLFLLMIVNIGKAQNGPVSLKSLLHEMVDRDALATYPNPYYTTRQFSSYDRNAQKPGTKSWFANWDRTQFMRSEQNKGRKEYVMLDTKGPGAIVRFWMTFAGEGAGQGTLRIYFDGEKEPAFEGKAFDVLSGGKLVGMPLAMSVSSKTDYGKRGHNLYLPLPFKTSCKITYQSEHVKSAGAKSGGENVYYNINYRDYEKGTNIKTFKKEQLKENKELLRKVQEKLLYREKDYYLSHTKTQKKSFEHAIEVGDSNTIEINGPAAIRRLSLSLEADDAKQALRSTIMQISFDGEQTVWVPIGDFFGTGYQYRKSDTWFTTVTESGQMAAYWVMPFQKEAKITFKNLGDQKIGINGDIWYSDWDWNSRSMHFGASWHQYSDLDTRKSPSGDDVGDYYDINYTKLKGQGVYVGDALTLFNTSYAWWGEGDEKIYIDGEAFPSNFGTGSEDYYGYAWARPEAFTNHPFISQPDGSGNITPGFTIDMRLRSLDAIPFQQNLVMDMEMWHWAHTLIDYAPTTYFYLKPHSKSLVQPSPGEARKEVALRRSDIISPKIKDNRMEGESLIVDSFSGGGLTFQELDNVDLSQNKQLWWHNGVKGDVLKTSFVADEKGTYAASINFVLAPDYGTVSVLINGETILKEFNGYASQVSTEQVEVGKVNLKQGKNSLQIKITGKDEKSKDFFFGLDYIDFNK